MIKNKMAERKTSRREFLFREGPGAAAATYLALKSILSPLVAFGQDGGSTMPPAPEPEETRSQYVARVLNAIPDDHTQIPGAGRVERCMVDGAEGGLVIVQQRNIRPYISNEQPDVVAFVREEIERIRTVQDGVYEIGGYLWQEHSGVFPRNPEGKPMVVVESTGSTRFIQGYINNDELTDEFYRAHLRAHATGDETRLQELGDRVAALEAIQRELQGSPMSAALRFQQDRGGEGEVELRVYQCLSSPEDFRAFVTRRDITAFFRAHRDARREDLRGSSSPNDAEGDSYLLAVAISESNGSLEDIARACNSSVVRITPQAYIDLGENTPQQEGR